MGRAAGFIPPPRTLPIHPWQHVLSAYDRSRKRSGVDDHQGLGLPTKARTDAQTNQMVIPKLSAIRIHL